jgi:hypothetical protein
MHSRESRDEVVRDGVGPQAMKDDKPDALYRGLFNGMAIYACDWLDKFIHRL